MRRPLILLFLVFVVTAAKEIHHLPKFQLYNYNGSRDRQVTDGRKPAET